MHIAAFTAVAAVAVEADVPSSPVPLAAEGAAAATALTVTWFVSAATHVFGCRSWRPVVQTDTAKMVNDFTTKRAREEMSNQAAI